MCHESVYKQSDNCHEKILHLVVILSCFVYCHKIELVKLPVFRCFHCAMFNTERCQYTIVT